MNEKNFLYLKDNIKYLGFGENLDEALKTRLGKELSDFSITYRTEINRKPFEAALHFKKSDSADFYFLNAYSASLQRSNGEKMQQTFHLNRGKGVTAKEAYNLLEGRAVYKELSNKLGEYYKAWLQIDFENKDKNGNYEIKQYHENYGFDLRSSLGKFAVAELNDSQKEKALMQSLQKGNLQAVTIDKEGVMSKMFLEANPQYKVVTLYHTDFRRVQKDDIARYQSVGTTSEHATVQDLSDSKDQMKDKKQDVKAAMDTPAKGQTKPGKKSMTV